MSTKPPKDVTSTSRVLQLFSLRSVIKKINEDREPCSLQKPSNTKSRKFSNRAVVDTKVMCTGIEISPKRKRPVSLSEGGQSPNETSHMDAGSSHVPLSNRKVMEVKNENHMVDVLTPTDKMELM